MRNENEHEHTRICTRHVRSRKNANIYSRSIRLDSESLAGSGRCVAVAAGKGLISDRLRAGIIGVVCLGGRRATGRPHGEWGANARTACCRISHRSGRIVTRRDHKRHGDRVRLRAAGGNAITQAVTDKPVCAEETDY